MAMTLDQLREEVRGRGRKELRHRTSRWSVPDDLTGQVRMLTLMQRLGLEVEDFGDSTGEFMLSIPSSPAVTTS